MQVRSMRESDRYRTEGVVVLLLLIIACDDAAGETAERELENRL